MSQGEFAALLCFDIKDIICIRSYQGGHESPYGGRNHEKVLSPDSVLYLTNSCKD